MENIYNHGNFNFQPSFSEKDVEFKKGMASNLLTKKNVKGWILFLTLLLMGLNSFAQGTVVVNSTVSGFGSWTNPFSCSVSLKVEGWGAGGGGGGAGTNNKGGGGGGAGGYVSSTIVVAAGATVNYSIGAFGAGGASGNNAGSAGGNTTITSGSVFTANGGAAGGAASGVTTATGGTASGGTTNTTGGSAEASGSGFGGAGGVNAASGSGAAGARQVTNNTAGNVGTAPGGGGGGAYRQNASRAGGNGGNGGVKFTVLDREINVLNDTPANILTGGSFNFANTSVSGGTDARTFTIQNLGLAGNSLTVSNVSVAGGNASDFIVSAISLPATVAGASSTNFTVTFDPSAAGARTTTLTIASNDCDEASYTITLNGTGLDPEIDIQESAVSITDGSGTTAFGNADIVSGTVVKTFTIFNTGTQALTVGAITIAGADAADFTVTSAPPASIAAGANATFQVTFDPSTGGAKNATISIVNNDGNENPYDWSFTGTGLVPEIDIQGNSISIVDGDIAPSTTDFTDFLGNATRTFTILNTGAGTLTIGAISFSGTNAASFSVTTAPAATVAPGASTIFVVTCSSAIAGTKTATISIANNDSNENPYDFALQATPAAAMTITGIDNATPVAPFTINPITTGNVVSTTNGTSYGTTDVNTGAIFHTFTINNTGSLALSITSLTLGGGSPADYKVSTQPASSVTAGGSTTFVVKFNPSASRARAATLTIATNDPTTPSFVINLTGTGTSQEIDVQGNGVSIPGDAAGFATVTTANFTDFSSTNVTRTFTIKNTGTSALTIGSITFTGTNPGDFSVSTAPASSVQAGSSTTFVVTFAPTATGVRTANINIFNNDITSDTAANGTLQAEGNSTSTVAYIFKIQGTGVAAAMSVTGVNTGTGVSGVAIVSGSAVGSAGTANGTDFGSAALTGPAFTYRTYTISNITAGIPITLGAFSFDTTAGSGSVVGTTFTITSAVSSTTVNGGQSVTFTVRYNPTGGTSGTAQTQRLVIAYSNPGATTYTFFLKGTPTNSVSTRLMSFQTLGGSVTVANGDVSPTLAKGTDVGNTSIDSGSITVNYLLKNTGTGTLNLGSIFFTGAAASDFSVVLNSNISQSLSIATGATRPLQISFNPTTAGTKTAILHISSDDSSGVIDYQVTLTGLGFKAFPDTDSDGVYNDVDVDDDNDGIPDVTEQNDCLLSGRAKTVTYTYLNEDFGYGISRGQINVNTPLATTAYCYEDGIQGSKIPNTTVGASDYCAVSLTNDGSSTIDDGEYAVYAWVGDDANSGAGYFTGTPAYFDVHSSTTAWRGKIQDHTAGDTNGRMAIFNADANAGNVFYNFSIAGVLPNSPITLTFSVVNILSKANYSGSFLPVLQAKFYDLSDNFIAGSTFTTPNIGRCDDTTDNAAAPAKGTAAGNLCLDPSVWLTYSTTINLGALTGFKIKISNNCTGGGGNDLAIDDIIVKQDYCDLEDDKMPCIYDLDSDDDGIPDAEENGYGSKMNGKSYLQVGFSSYADTNGNGWRDDVENDIYNETNPDTWYDADADGVMNYLDHDSDNDGILDTSEGNALTGKCDVDDDGVTDVSTDDRTAANGGALGGDGDGIVGTGDANTSPSTPVMDDLVGFGTTTGTLTIDSDGDGIKDYLDIDSKALDVDTNGDGIADLNTYDIANTIYADLDADNNGIIDSVIDLDREGIMASRDSDETVVGSPRSITKNCMLEFDGVNDYAVDSTLSLAGMSTLTVMGWVDGSFSGTMDLIGQTNFKLSINSSRRLVCTITTSTGTSTFTGTASYTSLRWTHIAVTYDGANVKFFFNGINTVSFAKTGAIAADASTFTIGKTPGAWTNFFKGRLDEFRIFDIALTSTQVQRMVNQEISNNGGQVRGDIIPIDIGTLPFANMIRYYKMNNYRGSIADDATTGTIDTGSGLKIMNVKNIYLQNAPLPFVTKQTGDFTTAVTDLRNHINGGDIVAANGNAIVQVKHNITEPSNTSTIGLIVDPAITVTMNGDNKLQNDWYLKFDDKIDLQGKSQLVQTTNSILDVTSAGYIERDQQGQLSMYNYNYWSSPVGVTSTTTNNNNYTIDGQVKDGTDPNNVQNLHWTANKDVTATTPITLSSRWIFMFQNQTSTYANWTKIDQHTSLAPAVGFTLKGGDPSTGAGTVNYTFVGKPNNGTITLAIAAASSNLCGNPYPSALDANAFITYNTTTTPSISGSLYFWEQYASNPSHVLSNYEGGYGVYTLVGGTSPVSPTGVSGLGTSSHGAPHQYIPVGQAFFVNSDVDGGTITFDNSMRAFIKEDNAASGYMFRKNPITVNEVVKRSTPNNADDPVTPDTHEKIKIGFNSHDNYHREILIGFMDDKATSGIDQGYDAVHIDNQPNDMYFLNNGLKLNIQGEGYFKEDASYLLGVKTDAQGLVSFVFVNALNSPTNREIYIYDSLTGESHNIKNGKFEVTLDQGVFEDRFYLRFKKTTALGLFSSENNDKLSFSFTANNNTINISNGASDVEIQKVTLLSILGQEIATWKTSTMDQSAIELPVRNISVGTYLVKISTSKGDFTKKIVVKN